MSIPRSIAFIPDGNARWAKNFQKTIQEGHYYGLKNLHKILDHCRSLGIYCISIYGFSTENWKRPAKERNDFFETAYQFLQDYCEEILQKETKFVVLGNIDSLPEKLKKIMQNLVQKSQNYQKHLLQICVNYGGRQEILRSCNTWIQKHQKENKNIPLMTTNDFENHLYTNPKNDPDLLIRTGGTMRLSNFLLYQLSYTELYFSKQLWPEFDEKSLDNVLIEFANRKRNFGGRPC